MSRQTSGTDPAGLAERWLEAFNARDEQALWELYRPDATIKRPTWPNEGDLEASLASIRLDFGAYPDGQLEPRRVVARDQVVVVEFQFEGTNTEPITLFSGQEIPATDRRLSLHGTIHFEVDQHGRIHGEAIPGDLPSRGVLDGGRSHPVGPPRH